MKNFHKCQLFVLICSRVLQGVVSVAQEPRRVLVQAVQELVDRQPTTPWGNGEQRVNRLVFIGEISQFFG